jgi:hypothetical protein
LKEGLIVSGAEQSFAATTPAAVERYCINPTQCLRTSLPTGLDHVLR